MSDDQAVNQNTGVFKQQPAQTPTDSSPFSSPVGSANKEAAPISPTLSELKPSGAEVSHEISQELKDMGVEEKKDRPDLTDAHKEIGMNHSGISIPAPTASANSIKYPMSEAEMLDKLKTGKSDDSGRGLAVLIQKVMRAMGFQ